jgi:acetyl esterase/lipase
MWIDESMVAYAFLGLSLVGAIFTLNAFMPVRRVPALFVPSFFGSWLTAELALHHIVWQAIAAVLFVELGALSSWPGMVGLGITVASWLGLMVLFHHGRTAGETFDQALGGLAEPAGAARMPLAQLVMPFRFRRRGVKVIRNVVFRKVAGKTLRLDVAMPERPGVNRPAIMQVHGGAWIIGDKREQGWPLIGHLAANGRPPQRFEVRPQLDPRARGRVRGRSELRGRHGWLGRGTPHRDDGAHGKRSGIPTRLRDRGYQRTSRSARVRSLRFHEPSRHDARRFSISDARTDDHEGFFEEEPEKFRRASPIDRIRPDAPPFLIVHGDRDTLAPVEDARLFAELLRGVSRAPVIYTELRGAQHAFDLFASPRTARMLDGTLRFLTAMYERSRAAHVRGATELMSSPPREQHLAVGER